MGAELMEAAMWYSRLGLAVLPLYPNTKKPMFDNWTNLERAAEPLVSRWWKQNPQANVGIMTGEKSNCFVLDVDTKNGGDVTFDRLVHEHGRFPETWQQITGTGGWHLFFRYPNFRVGNAAGIFEGIDIRGTGGQVVAPPSIHPDTGKRYEWDGLKDIEHQPMAEAPLWLLDVLQGKAEHKKPLLEIPFKIHHGVQHQTLVSFAGMMRRLGLDAEEILPSLLKVNERRCELPGAPENIHQIAQSMMKYRPADGDLLSTATRLWRVTKAKEHEAKREVDRLSVPVVDGLTVYRSPVADNRSVIEGLLLNGLTILAGRPKVGKSWLTLQMALAVSLGTPYLKNRDVLMPGRVVYLALEESQRRTSGRMKKLMSSESVLLQNLNMVYKLMPLLGGGSDQLKAVIDKHSPALVIIDTFLAAVGSGHGKTDVMRSEYREIDTLHKIAETANTAIVLVHHKRKANGLGGTGLDSVAGSTGVTAAADSIWTIEKQDDGNCLLEVTGRDIEDQSLALKFTKDSMDFGWSIIGDGETVRNANEEREIMILLNSEGKLSPSRVAGLLRMNANRVRVLLDGLLRHGMISRDSRGNFYMSQVASEEYKN